MTRTVVVTADDLGMSDAVNEAIARAVDQGLVTSTSVLAVGPAAEAALGWLRGGPPVAVGVHLCLTAFAPLTDLPARLRGPDGAMTEACWRPPPEALDAIVAEWDAQVARVRAAGVTPVYLDSHQHVHWQEVPLRALRVVQARHGIERVRTRSAVRSTLLASVAHAREAWEAARYQRALRAGPPPTRTTDLYTTVDTFRRLRPRAASVELGCHPGNPTRPVFAEELAWLATRPFDGPGWRRVGWDAV